MGNDPRGRIPEVGDDGLRRLNCPKCNKLQFRFDRRLRGGPVERQCDKPSCKHKFQVWFNEEGPAQWT